MTHAVKFRTEDGVLHDHAPKGQKYHYVLPGAGLTDAHIRETADCRICWPPRVVAAQGETCIDCAKYRAGGRQGKGTRGHFIGHCKLDRTLSTVEVPKGWPTVRGDTDTCGDFAERPAL